MTYKLLFSIHNLFSVMKMSYYRGIRRDIDTLSKNSYECDEYDDECERN